MNVSVFLTVVLVVLRKDLRAELRSREIVSAMLLFAALSVLVFSFALDLVAPDATTLNLQDIAGAVLWATVIFALVLGLNRNLVTEREGGSMDAMLLAPVPRAALFLGKALANFTFALVVGLLLLPLISLLYNVNLLVGGLVVILTLGLLGLAAVGTLLAAMTVQTRARDTLLPIVLLPAALPVLSAVTQASNAIIGAQTFERWGSWVGLLLLLDTLYIIVSVLLFPFVVEE